MRKMLVVIDRIELKYFEFNQLVTNFWIVKGLLENGVETYITTIDNLSLKQGKGCANCWRTYTEKDDIFYDKDSFADYVLEDFEKIFFRPDPPVDNDYINATYIFDFVDRNKTEIINDTKAIRDFNEKLHANYFKEFMPENIVTASKDEIENFLAEQGEIILKPLNQCFGSGVMYFKNGETSTPLLVMYMMYLCNSIYGYYNWIQLEKRHHQH